MSAPLNALLKAGGNHTFAVVGCGGKTGLIGCLARQNRGKKVLVTPTTHIYPMQGNDIILCTTRAACLAHKPVPGVQCLGVLDETTGKLGPLPEKELEGLAAGYDLVLMEADGSAGLPCKGWKADEPVVPHFTGCTVGVLPITALGARAQAENVLRLPLFLKLTGLAEGDSITMPALAAMAMAPGGMFQHSKGKRALVINQADSGHGMEAARQLVGYIKERWPGLLCAMVAGSVQNNSWQQL